MGSRRTHAALRRRAGIALAVWAVAFSMLAAASAVPDGPHASLTVSPSNPRVDQTVWFNASASDEHDEGNGQIVAYRFDFGDGTGTGWQTSATATHAYTVAGNYTASVTVKDKRSLTGSASAAVRVLPPPPPVPDVRPVLADLVPARPAVGDFVNLTIVLLNRGTATALAASVTVTDIRPNGTTASLGRLFLAEPLPPSGVVPLVCGPFRAAGPGNHTLQIRVTYVSPPEPNLGQGVLNVTMTVVLPTSSPPPPTGPELRLLAGLLDPSHPRKGQSVNLSVIIWNRGTAAAETATVDAYDVQPNGTVAFLGGVPLPGPLPSSSGETLVFPPFVASGVGNHTIRLVVASVTPPQLSSGGGELDIIMSVSGTSTIPPADHNPPPPLEFGPLALGLAAAALATGAGAALVLLRPRPIQALEPPPATPPDRSPPPIWPP